MAAGSAGLTQLRRGVLEHCVLALLADGERYGYDLVQELAAADLLASEGTIYPLLSRLRSEGSVQTTWRDSSSGPARRYYSLTPHGRAVLAEFRTAWGDFADTVTAILNLDPGDQNITAHQKGAHQ